MKAQRPGRRVVIKAYHLRLSNLRFQIANLKKFLCSEQGSKNSDYSSDTGGGHRARAAMRWRQKFFHGQFYAFGVPPIEEAHRSRKLYVSIRVLQNCHPG